MSSISWLKQSRGKPLFPDLLWSRPENKRTAGKLLIVGGNLHGFAAVAEAYGAAMEAGAGSVRVVLPEALAKTIGKVFPAAEFAPSTGAGSFSRQALSEILSAGGWADGTLLAGDFGRNSETCVMLESFVTKYKCLLTLAGDSIDAFMNQPSMILDRPETTLILSFPQLQKLAVAAKSEQAFTTNLDLLNFVERLHVFSSQHQANLIVNNLDKIFVVAIGKVSSTDSAYATTQKTAAAAAVWWLQNPGKTFEALTTSLLES